MFWGVFFSFGVLAFLVNKAKIPFQTPNFKRSKGMCFAYSFLHVPNVNVYKMELLVSLQNTNFLVEPD